MPATIVIRFPLGRYHATPWDRSVNEGTAEWPPSPWRVLRALIATWHTRWPDLPAEAFDNLLSALGDPPAYLTPLARPGHTRHYMPSLDHKSGLPDARKQRPKAEENDPSGRELTFDPFLSLRRAGPAREEPGELLVQWDTDLDAGERSVLAKLAELLPYLGRAESVCDAQLLDNNPVPDETWWRPGAEGARTTRLLAPTLPVRRETLEVTTVQVRKMRRTQPPGTTWVTYATAAERSAPPLPRSAVPLVNAVRLAVVSRAPVKLTHSILLADAVHAKTTRLFPDDVSRHVLGYRGAATDHQHAHWVPLPDPAGREDRVQALLIYVPHGLTADEVSRLLRIREVSGRVGGGGNGHGYEFRGLPPVQLLLQAAGPAHQVAPELCGPARRWRSLTPYLPVRYWHRKRETLAEYLTTDVNAELAYRELPQAAVRPAAPADGLPDRWARGFRRYRMKENLGSARPGLGLVLDFAEPVLGPVMLGQLSHFGYGTFIPDES